MRFVLPLAASFALAACATVGAPAPGGTASGPAEPGGATVPAPTTILSAADAVRLRQNSGITLQWIGWDERGTATVTEQAGRYRLSARQAGGEGGLLTLDGAITEIGPDYFVFDGAIAISDTPDRGRNCFADKTWRFEVTQGRRYYRLREFEWCDGLTDYIDIYF